MWAFLADVFTPLPGSGYWDMLTLPEVVIKSGDKADAFPLNEYWLDIVKLSDVERGTHEFKEAFR